MAKRERGAKYPKGYMKRKILLLICQNHPEGIKEPDLRDTLRELYGIREARGIKEHLAFFERKGYVIKIRETGKANTWKIPDKSIFIENLRFKSIPSFISYAQWFLFSEDKKQFLESSYAQKILTDEHLNQIALSFWKSHKEAFRNLIKFVTTLEKDLTEPFKYNVATKIKESTWLLTFLLFPERLEEIAKEFSFLFKEKRI